MSERCSRLASRLGIDVPPDYLSELHEHLEEATETALDALRAARLIPNPLPPDSVHLTRLALPKSVAHVLGLAIADARLRGMSAHADLLVLTYLESLPRARLVQLTSDRAPHDWLFHAPIPWDALPRFRRGLARLFELFDHHQLSPKEVVGPDAKAFLDDRPTLADFYVRTYYGRLQPMFAALEHDLDRLHADVLMSPAQRWDIVDRRLSQAMLHELLHFGPHRDAIFPPYLDEAIAAHFGLLLDATVAFPEAGDDSALIGWPWFSQVGAALARVVGDGPLLAAQAGLRPWEEVMDPGLLSRLEHDAWAAYQAAPSVHFHPDITRPDRWVRIIYEHMPPAPDEPRDRVMLEHALTAMCLRAEQIHGCWHVTRQPPDGHVTVDFAAGVVRAPPRRTGWEPAPLLHVLPPSLMYQRPPCDVVLDADPEAIRVLAAELMNFARAGA